MSGNRMSGLCALAVEYGFAIDFEELTDDIGDLHKNSNILLKSCDIFGYPRLINELLFFKTSLFT